MNGDNIDKVLDFIFGYLIFVSILFALASGEMVFYFIAFLAFIAFIGPVSGLLLGMGIDKALNCIR